MGSSIKELSRSLELNPANAEAQKSSRSTAASIGRYDLAESELLEATRLKPESGEIHYFLARTYYTERLPSSEIRIPSCDPTGFLIGSKAISTWELPWRHLATTPKRLRITLERSNSRSTKNTDQSGHISISAPFYNRQKKSGPSSSYARKASS